MKSIELRNINNPREWVIDGTNIFIIPQRVVQTSDASTLNYTIRHGCFAMEDGKLLGKISDYIENGADDVGGFVTFNDVINYIKREAEICENVHKYCSLGMYEHAVEFWVEANKNSRFYKGHDENTLRKIGLNKMKHANICHLEMRAIAWRRAYEDCVDAMQRGVVKDELPITSYAS